MKTTKLIALAALVPLFAGVTQAQAATKKKKPPKPVCNLVTDSKDDATGTGTGQAGPYDANLDIVSADVATNGKLLEVTIRLADLKTGADQNAPTGWAYQFTFVAPGGTGPMRATVSPAGNGWPGGPNTGVVDTTKKEIRWWVPLTFFSFPIKPGQKLTGLQASSWRGVGTTDGSLGLVDGAASNTAYTVGAASCVKVGA
jgi:hypothetical protein